MSITISNPVTEAHIVTVGEHKLFFCCNTLIAYCDNHQAIRASDLSSCHLNELGCREFEILPGGKDELSAHAQRAMLGRQ